MSRKEKLSKFHRESILSVASELFEENGVEKTTVDMICKRAEYSKATVYVYFQSKDEILDAIVLESMKWLKNKIKIAINKSLTSEDCYFGICNAVAVMQEEKPIYFERMIENINVNIESAETPKIYSEIYQIGEEINVLLYRFAEVGIRKGEVQNVDIPSMIFMLWSCITGVVRMAFQKEEYLEKSIEMSREEYLKYGFEQLACLILVRDNL
ncbi:TetR family transcriptional regulator [Clostridia bacterium]|nr:TetR family transcriptional regulator [Clostridia bacterium]